MVVCKYVIVTFKKDNFDVLILIRKEILLLFHLLIVSFSDLFGSSYVIIMLLSEF